jgi:quercetin dioxygenase-like cupin family protein
MITEFPGFIRRLPEIEIGIEGVSGHLLQGAHHQVAFVHFDRDTDVPEHSHRAQWEVVITGEVRLRMGGNEETYTAGQSFFIPEGVGHGAFVHAGYRAIIVFDQSDRYALKTV